MTNPTTLELARAYPEAGKIILVRDNLNTHNPSSYHETFSSEKAFALTQHFEMRCAPRKANWLNMAEIELPALSKQCLDRRLEAMETFAGEVESWARERNRKRITVSWQFPKNDAREKFKRFYSSV